MKRYSVWKNEEVKNLFALTAEYRCKNQSLLYAFEAYAQKTGRKRNSVRNYYYQELAALSENEQRRKLLGIDLSQHTISPPKTFSDQETEEVITEISRLVSTGISVRKACLQLSENNIAEMVRLQNKYRNVIKNNPEFVKKCAKNLKNKENPIKKPLSQEKPSETNVIAMPIKTKQKLSDHEINSLFLGLVKLVKRCAAEEAESKHARESQVADNTIRKTLVQLSSKESENKALTEKYTLIVKEKIALENEVFHLKSEVASLMSEKMKKLKNFFKKTSQSPLDKDTIK